MHVILIKVFILGYSSLSHILIAFAVDLGLSVSSAFLHLRAHLSNLLCIVLGIGRSSAYIVTISVKSVSFVATTAGTRPINFTI